MGNNFSRRDFLKGAAAGAFGLATAGILGGMGKASAEGIYTPGTYTATAQGVGTVKMTAVFDANSIVSIDLDLAEETPAIGQAAKDAIIIGHSQFEKIPMSLERQKYFLQSEIDELTHAIADLKYQRGERVTIKQLEKSIKQK